MTNWDRTRFIASYTCPPAVLGKARYRRRLIRLIRPSFPSGYSRGCRAKEQETCTRAERRDWMKYGFSIKASVKFKRV